MLVGLHWVSKKAKDGGDGKSGVLPTTWMVLFQRTISRTPGWAKITSLHKCLVGSNAVAPEGSMLLHLSLPRNLRVRQTFMAGPREPRLSGSWQSWIRRFGDMGSHLQGGVLMVRSTALRRDATWKLSNASGVKLSCLWRKRTWRCSF